MNREVEEAKRIADEALFRAEAEMMRAHRALKAASPSEVQERDLQLKAAEEAHRAAVNDWSKASTAVHRLRRQQEEVERQQALRQAVADAHRQNGAKGGATAAARMAEIRAYALQLARERQPIEGWKSAPAAADAIRKDVLERARQLGRACSQRKLEEWLRADGVRRPKRTASG